MATAPAIDLRANAPTALSLAHAAKGVSSGADPWDPGAWQAGDLGELTGLSALMVYWEPWFAAGRFPGEELREALSTRWPADSYERDLVTATLQEADALDHPTLVKEEFRSLGAERTATASPREIAYYDLLLACLVELRDIARLKKRGGQPAFVVHPESMHLAQWTMHNLLRFLQAHWALRRVHGKVARLIERRLAALNRLAGLVEGPGDFADSHDETE